MENEHITLQHVSVNCKYDNRNIIITNYPADAFIVKCVSNGPVYCIRKHNVILPVLEMGIMGSISVLLSLKSLKSTDKSYFQ